MPIQASERILHGQPRSHHFFAKDLTGSELRELTGFQSDEIAKLFAEEEADLVDEERIPRMECQAFEHHDYLVFMFHDQRDWMQALQLLGAKPVTTRSRGPRGRSAWAGC